MLLYSFSLLNGFPFNEYTMYVSIFIVDGHLGCFQVGDVNSSAARDIETT